MSEPSPTASRRRTVKRDTRETCITLTLDLDQPPADEPAISTGVGFFDHMLNHITRHGRMLLEIDAEGDYHIDDHHTVEDVGIVLGSALAQCLGDKKGIERYGFASVPMDEALARVSLDLSGRAAIGFHAQFSGASARIGTFEVQLVEEFFRAVAHEGKLAIHIEAPYGRNDHHMVEAIFKAFGRALRQAVALTGTGIPSTKGVL
ncbi:MAG: imidazoleglycerol-phosphate dehydratase HisB [Phycisphaeraceae bacterium]|nr:imidazoleglycerol-phosphate dehydratase HisB [Phycisphaeraceae bacterium]